MSIILNPVLVTLAFVPKIEPAKDNGQFTSFKVEEIAYSYSLLPQPTRRLRMLKGAKMSPHCFHPLLVDKAEDKSLLFLVLS
jgi:hypothetical protein